MKTALTVLIATAGEPTLLRRALDTLAACDKPASYRGAVIVENGPKHSTADVVRQYADSCGTRYLYHEPPNKCAALNYGLRRLEPGLVVFTDDDVRLDQSFLTAYANASAGIQRGEFYGGPLEVDFEAEPPPAWLRRFLPKSCKGWRLEVSGKHEVMAAEFIGSNMAAFTTDLAAIGGFDPRLGPGKTLISCGDETDLQLRLLNHGVRGFYVPDAVIHHLARKCVSSKQWVIDRMYRRSVAWGIRTAQQRGFLWNRYRPLLREAEEEILKVTERREAKLCRTSKFLYHFTKARWRGRWEGIRRGLWMPPWSARKARRVARKDRDPIELPDTIAFSEQRRKSA